MKKPKSHIEFSIEVSQLEPKDRETKMPEIRGGRVNRFFNIFQCALGGPRGTALNRMAKDLSKEAMRNLAAVEEGPGLYFDHHHRDVDPELVKEWRESLGKGFEMFKEITGKLPLPSLKDASEKEGSDE